MSSKRCINCNCKFYPQKHIKKQRYCSKKACQNARRGEWLHSKLESDKDYKINKKKAQYKWKSKNTDYWTRYKKRITDNQLDKKLTLEILLRKNTLADLHKEGTISCDCKIVLTS